MTKKIKIQYGKVKINQKGLDGAHVQMYQYIIAAINHVFDMTSYIDLYGEEYVIKTQPNITEESILEEHLSKSEPVPFYAQSDTDSLKFVVDSLNQKNQGENLLGLMLLVDNYLADFEYVELLLDDNLAIKEAYSCESSICYKDVSESPDEIDIQAILEEKTREPIELESVKIPI